jgi:hypothetical protein
MQDMKILQATGHAMTSLLALPAAGSVLYIFTPAAAL